jgi:hypothetical protein
VQLLQAAARRQCTVFLSLHSVPARANSKPLAKPAAEMREIAEACAHRHSSHAQVRMLAQSARGALESAFENVAGRCVSSACKNKVHEALTDAELSRDHSAIQVRFVGSPCNEIECALTPVRHGSALRVHSSCRPGKCRYVEREPREGQLTALTISRGEPTHERTQQQGLFAGVTLRHMAIQIDIAWFTRQSQHDTTMLLRHFDSKVLASAERGKFPWAYQGFASALYESTRSAFVEQQEPSVATPGRSTTVHACGCGGYLCQRELAETATLQLRLERCARRVNRDLPNVLRATSFQ